MKKFSAHLATQLAAIALLAGISGAANATPVLLGQVFHDYGSAAGKLDPSGNDALAADYVTVSDQSSNRFSDAFDFSGLNFDSVSQFRLTLSFSGTNNLFEYWHARPGQSSTLQSLNFAGSTVTSQTFTFGPSVDTFAASVAAESFNLWFAEQGWGAHNFRLYDATLAVYGEASEVPEPTTLAMLGLGLAGLAASRRLKS